MRKLALWAMRVQSKTLTSEANCWQSLTECEIEFFHTMGVWRLGIAGFEILKINSSLFKKVKMGQIPFYSNFHFQKIDLE